MPPTVIKASPGFIAPVAPGESSALSRPVNTRGLLSTPPPVCTTDEELNGNALDIWTQQFPATSPNFTSFDNIVLLPRAWKRLLIASIGPVQGNDALGHWLSIIPTGKQNQGAPFVPTGAEAWIQLHSLDVGSTVFIEGTIIEFRYPIDRFYMHFAGTAAFAGEMMTFLRGDDVQIHWKPAQSTTG